MLIPGTKKEDFLEGQFAYPGDKEGGLPGRPVCLCQDKEGGLPGGPVCLSRGQRRRTSWRATQFTLKTKKEDLLIPGTKKEDFLEGQFAFPGNKEGGLPGGQVCLS